MEGSRNQEARGIYSKALRLGQKEYGARTARGERPSTLTEAAMR